MLNEIFQAFLITSFAGAVLTLLLALLKPVTKKLFSYSWQYYVWLGVLVVLLIPIRINLPEREPSGADNSVSVKEENFWQPSVSKDAADNSQESLTPNLPDGNWEDTPVYTPNNYQTTLPDIPADTEYNSSGTMPDTPANSSGSTVDNTVSSEARPALWQNFRNAVTALWASIAGITPILSVIWVLGILVTLFLTLAGYRKLIHTVKSDFQPVTCTALTSYTKKNLTVYRCRAVASPFIFGLWRPTLVLPDKALSKEQLDNILRHETTHLNRNDLWYKWFAVLVRCLHWFNPAVYYVVKQINTECEISCDLSVVKNMDREDELRYINTILSLLTQKAHVMPLTTGMTGSKKSLKRRFLMIKNKKNTTRLMIIVSIVLALVILLVALLASGVLSDWAKKEALRPVETPIPTATATLTPDTTPEPTEAPAKTPLTEEELRFFNEEFFVSARSTETKFPGVWVRNNLLIEEFDSPTQADLDNMFYDEAGEEISSYEISSLKLGETFQSLDHFKLSRNYVEEMVQYYLGITLSECEQAGPFTYYPERNAFYEAHSDALLNILRVTSGYRLGDTLTLYYCQNLDPVREYTTEELAALPQYVVTLKDTGDHYQFLKNERVAPQPTKAPENTWISVGMQGYLSEDIQYLQQNILLPAIAYVHREASVSPLRQPDISQWRINSIKPLAIYTSFIDTKLHLYEVDFCLLAKEPERIEALGCSPVSSDGWFVTDASLHHYLLFLEEESGALTYLTSWKDYGVPYDNYFMTKLRAYYDTIVDDSLRENLAYVDYMDSHVAVVDYVEWVVDDSPRGIYLGVEEQPNGYIIYNPVERFEIYPLAEDVVIEIFPPGYGDWIQTTPEECLENCHAPLFVITMENGEIVHMQEHYEP